MNSPSGRLNPLRVVSLEDQWTDLAGYLSGLEGLPYYAARVAWGLDESSMRRAEIYLWQEAASLAADLGWKVETGKEHLRKLSRIAVYEMHDPVQWSFTLPKAAVMGCSEAQWRRKHRRRYDEIYALAMCALADAFGHIIRSQRPGKARYLRSRNKGIDKLRGWTENDT